VTWLRWGVFRLHTGMSNFEVLKISLQWITELKSLIEKIEVRDRSLAEQLRRAGSSVPLNISEGAKREKKDRLYSFRIAAGSASEAQTALAIAKAWGYISQQEYSLPNATGDRILAILWRLTHPRH
jgi:four helix bundle protein